MDKEHFLTRNDVGTKLNTQGDKPKDVHACTLQSKIHNKSTCVCVCVCLSAVIKSQDWLICRK